MNLNNIKDPKAREIMQYVLENRAKLEGCPCHDFSIDLRESRPYGADWECSNCHGRVTGEKKYWYEQGLKHGRCFV